MVSLSFLGLFLFAPVRIQYRENVFKGFAAEHPEDFNKWLDKQK